KDRIIAWLIHFLPTDRSLATQIWHDVNIQTSNYIRGKFWEIILVWSVTHITFNLFGLNSPLLLSLFVGLSVMVPYLGAAIMYIPISLVAFYQFGWDPMLFWVLLAYTVIQILDGNVLAPILLSEVTSLHPVAVIVAILIFGGLWGFWGVFFAIPLATLVNAIIKAWPTEFNHPAAETPSPKK
ncbi:AI-2E family transporter, partial [Verrucomicrobia bacterium]|nr:AI-2E family transporter [Verrucomicrobiota bacterium]